MSIELFNVATFSTKKASAILDIGTAYQSVITFTTPVLETGVYMISYAFQVDFNGTKNQPMQFQITGTFEDTTEFTEVAGDQDADHKNRFYGFPKAWAGGEITIGLKMKKDVALAQLDCDFVDVMVQRVG